MIRALAPLAALALCACATLAPSVRYVNELGPPAAVGPEAPALVVVGDSGIAGSRARALAASLARRLEGTPGVPVLILGDVFYADGLLGLCPARTGRFSRRGCSAPGPREEQLEATLGPLRDALPGHPVHALAGNHDWHGGPAVVRETCWRVAALAPGFAFRSSECGLDPVRRLDAGALSVILLDSQRMLADRRFRAASLAALRRELRALAAERPEAWRLVATHHPLESHGSHNGARRASGLHKDLFPLLGTLLAPLYYPLGGALVPGPLDQDLYQWRYRALRRGLYRALRETPIHLMVSGHDHSLQLVEIDHPGVRWQLVSGAGALRTPLKTRGLDLLLANRLARLLGLGDWLPARPHRLRFGAGGSDDTRHSGRGYAVLVPRGPELLVEIRDLERPEPLATLAISRESAPPASLLPVH